MKYFILGIIFHIFLLNMIWLDAHIAWIKVNDTTRGLLRFQKLEETRICSSVCESYIRLEFSDTMKKIANEMVQ